jgi:DNA-binding transcriptional ArsR family regulator
MNIEVWGTPVSGTGDPNMARVFRALGDPTRLAIFETIRGATEPPDGRSPEEIENSISQIASQFELSLSTVSHHIRELRLAGLIRCERRGQSIHCFVDPAITEMASRFLDSAT